MFEINGTHIQGIGRAAGNLKVQLPLIAQDFPEVAQCFHGTINLLLEIPLLVLKPDHRTKPIFWTPGPYGEVFDLVRVALEAPKGAAPVHAWLYIAHWSPLRNDPMKHELIARHLPTAQVGTTCLIRLPRCHPCVCVL